MRRPQKVLLLGAGGMGMVPLALYLRGAGVRVEAFDDRFTEPLRSHLIDQGVKVLDELNPIKTPECIVYSSAISRDDDRLNKFKKMDCLCIVGEIFWPLYSPDTRSLLW